jgi:hypothetical protein
MHAVPFHVMVTITSLSIRSRRRCPTAALDGEDPLKKNKAHFLTQASDILQFYRDYLT